MKKKITLMLLGLLLLNSTMALAQQSHEKLIVETNYLLYLPDEYSKDTSAKFPLILFLHGSGERGTDVEKVKANGLPKLIAEGKKFPFIVVSPQAPEDGGWESRTLFLLLKDLRKRYRIDGDRLYLTGLSMGGFGSWDMAVKYPGLFAAVAPVCGGGDPSKAWQLRHTPLWVFHGAKDNVVNIRSSQEMVDAMKPVNPDVRFTVYPETGHNSWEEAYATDSLYTWMLKHKKFKYEAVKLKPAILERYIGDYVADNADTVTVNKGEGVLLITNKKGFKAELIPYAENRFFRNAEDHIDAVFNNKGEEEGFTVNAEKQYFYRRINNQLKQ